VETRIPPLSVIDNAMVLDDFGTRVEQAPAGPNVFSIASRTECHYSVLVNRLAGKPNG
jgi:hypothetical protein